MRIKLIAIATALVALGVGVATSQAALQNAVQVKINFKKAGGPGSLELQLINIDDVPLPEGQPLSSTALRSALYDGGLVPERVSKLILQTSSAKFNSKALPYCELYDESGNKRDIPTRASGMTGTEQYTYLPGANNNQYVKKNCPSSSIVGKGSFTAVVGTPGQPYDPSQSGAISGNMYLYNYKPRSGDRLGTLALLEAKDPVPANQYIYAGVDSRNVLRAIVPRRSELPTNLDASIPAGEVGMTSLLMKLVAPKPKKGKKPIITIKSFSNVSVYGQLVRD